jgi:hypothetical protein
MTKHTPTPYHVYSYQGQLGETAVVNDKGLIICSARSYENAAFIVKAVNNHEKLIEALEVAIQQIESSKEFNAPIKQSFDVKNLVANNLKKALSKAKE